METTIIASPDGVVSVCFPSISFRTIETKVLEERGQNACKACGSLAAAQSEFKKKFREKTKNDWDVVSVCNPF